MDAQLTLILGAAGTAITALASFIGFLFKREVEKNERLQREMREDDQKVAGILFQLHTFLNQDNPSNREILETLKRCEAVLQGISDRTVPSRRSTTGRK